MTWRMSRKDTGGRHLGARAGTASLSWVKDRYDMLESEPRIRWRARTMTGADMLVQVLADEGVDTIFGYSGGAILPIYDAVFRYNLEHDSAMPLIVPANEQGAAFMAAGYARASGRVGVALVTSGPGCHQYRDAGARLHGGLGADRGDLRPGADHRDRHRRVPGGAGAEHHGRGRQARLPDHRSVEDWRRRCAPPSRSRAPGGPARWFSTCRRMCRTGRACFTAPGACRSRATGSA